MAWNTHFAPGLDGRLFVLLLTLGPAGAAWRQRELLACEQRHGFLIAKPLRITENFHDMVREGPLMSASMKYT